MKTINKTILPVFAFICLAFITACSNGDSSVVVASETKFEQNFKEVDQSAEYEKNIMVLVNEYRNQHGLLPLDLNEEISEIARNHSKNMSNGLSIWGHEGYDERTKMVFTLIRWEEIGENLARNSSKNPPLKAMLGWINSPLHEDNLVGEFTITGIGVAKSTTGEYFFTQIFVRG